MKKKRNIIIAAMLLLTLVLPVRAQVFIMEEDEGPERNVLGVNGTWSNVIVHGSTDDQANYGPIGNGLLIMTAFGACYLMGKRRKDEC
jgi:hypothetical protein